jgi:MFS family permease
MLGLVNLAGSLPTVLLTMKGGSMADRHDKRKILFVCQLVQIALACVFGWLILTHQVTMVHVIVVAALLGISNAFEMPAASALVPELVGQEQIGAAIAIDRSTFHATRLIGPALAGLAIGAYGEASAFFANALSFVPLTLVLLTLPPRPLGTAEEEEQRGEGMGAGIAYVRGDAPTLAMIALIASTTFFVFPAMTVLMPLYAKDVLGLPPQGMGMLMSISAIGSLVGSAGLLGVRKDHRLFAIAAAASGVALAMQGLARAPGLWVACVGMVLLTVSMSTMMGLANTVVQERAPGPLRGRVSAIAGLSFFGMMPVAGLVMSGLSDWLGMRMAFSISGAIFALAAAIVLAGPGRRTLSPA